MIQFIHAHLALFVACVIPLLVAWLAIWPVIEDGGRRAGTKGFGFELGPDGLTVMIGDHGWRVGHRWSNDVFRPGLRLMMLRATNGPPPNVIWFIDLFGLEIGYAPNGRWMPSAEIRARYYWQGGDDIAVALSMHRTNGAKPERTSAKVIATLTTDMWTRDGIPQAVRTLCITMVGEHPLVVFDKKFRLPLNVTNVDWVIDNALVPDDKNAWDAPMLQRILDKYPIPLLIDPMVIRSDGAVAEGIFGYRIVGFARPDLEDGKKPRKTRNPKA